MSNSTKGAQSQIKRFEPNIRAPAHYTRPTNRTGQFSSTRNTHTRCSRASRTRSKLHGKATANRDTARIVELPFSRTSSDGFLTVSPFFLSFFFLLPPEIPTLDPFFILYFSHRLRCGAPLLLFLNQCEQHFLFPVITRNQRKSTEPTDKRRHESVTTRTRRYDTAATIENLRGGVSRERVGARSPSRRRRQVDQCGDKSAQMIRHELRYARPAVLPSTGAP